MADQVSVASKGWERERLPLVNSVSFADDRMILLSRPPASGNRFVLGPVADTTLASFLSYNPNAWVEIDVMVEADLPQGKLVAGGGAFEENGFVAVLDANERLVYSVCLDFPAPFTSIQIEEQGVTVSGQETQCYFELEKPWKLSFVRIEFWH